MAAVLNGTPGDKGRVLAPLLFVSVSTTAVPALPAPQATQAPGKEAGPSAGDHWDDLKLWYWRPAMFWTEALPVGNGRLGAMVYGRKMMARPYNQQKYQPLGDLRLSFTSQGRPTDQNKQLSRYRRELDQVIIVRLTADKPER